MFAEAGTNSVLERLPDYLLVLTSTGDWILYAEKEAKKGRMEERMQEQ